MGIFKRNPDKIYVGDSVEVNMNWHIEDIQELLEVGVVLEMSFWYIRVGHFRDSDLDFWYNLKHGCKKIQQ